MTRIALLLMVLLLTLGSFSRPAQAMDDPPVVRDNDDDDNDDSDTPPPPPEDDDSEDADDNNAPRRTEAEVQADLNQRLQAEWIVVNDERRAALEARIAARAREEEGQSASSSTTAPRRGTAENAASADAPRPARRADSAGADPRAKSLLPEINATDARLTSTSAALRGALEISRISALGSLFNTGAATRRTAFLEALTELDRNPAPGNEDTRFEVPVSLAAAMVELSVTRRTLRAVAGLADTSARTAQGAPDNIPFPAFQDGLPTRVEHLDAVISAGNRMMGDLKEGKDSKILLTQFLAEVQAHRKALVEGLNGMISAYPSSIADAVLPVVGDMPPLSSGANAETRLINYDFNQRTTNLNDNTLNAVFKPSSTAPKATGALTNVEDFNLDPLTQEPRVTMRLELRAVAMRKVAEALGMGDLVVKTHLAQLNGPDGQLGIIMERLPVGPGADGPAHQPTREMPASAETAAEIRKYVAATRIITRAQTELTTLEAKPEPRAAADTRQIEQLKASIAAEINLRPPSVREVQQANGITRLAVFAEERALSNEQLKNPELRKQLSNAQFLDALCGQVDRHMGNLFIQSDAATGNLNVRLIDNDLAFGTNNEEYGLARTDQRPKGEIPALPKAIDAALADRILALHRDTLDRATNGYLTKDERDALAGRLEMLKLYIQPLPRVHDRSQVFLTWGRSDPEELFHGHDSRALRVRDTPTGERTSYYGLLQAANVRGQPDTTAAAPLQ